MIDLMVMVLEFKIEAREMIYHHIFCAFLVFKLKVEFLQK